MAVERRLTEIAGPVGGKLHTARSRNDQVATDVALFVRSAAEGLDEAVAALMATLVAVAEAHIDWPMPGYTHLQRAQPVYLSHHLLAYVWMLERDRARLRFSASQTAALPLGAGALAGVNFDTDRRHGRRCARLRLMSRRTPSTPSPTATSSSICSTPARPARRTSVRLGAELVLWSSEEFGFVTLSDAWSSGSSIMPQKKNPDAAELLRAKAPRVVAHLAALHGVMHALPLTYNKDMQEDKEHLFDAVDTLALSLAAAVGMLAGATFNADRLALAASDELIAATDIADLLVKRGVPFRECHGIVAGLVRAAVDSGRKLSDFSVDELQQHSEHLDEGVYEVLSKDSWLESKVSEGGTSLARVREQLGAAKALLDA